MDGYEGGINCHFSNQTRDNIKSGDDELFLRQPEQLQFKCARSF
jgi:hypothetical protein